MTTSEFQKAPAQVMVHNAGPAAIAFAEVIDAPALMAWTFKEALFTPSSMPPLTRQVMMPLRSIPRSGRNVRPTLPKAYLESSVDECSLVWRALGQNLPCEFRAETTPLAILEIQLTTARG